MQSEKQLEIMHWNINLEFFDITEKKGFLRNLIIRMSSIGEIMVLFQFFQ